MADDDLRHFFGCQGVALRLNVWEASDQQWGQAIVHHYAHKTMVRLMGVDEPVHSNPTRAVPKILHFIWLGPHRIPMQEDINQTGWNGPMRSWQTHHPDFEVRLWDDQKALAGSSSFHNHDALEYAIQERNYGMASDILRLELLWEYGGFYVDVDYLCVAPMGNLINFDFVCGASRTGCVEINNGVMGCHPRHPLIRSMMESIHGWFLEYQRSQQPLAIMATFLDSASRDVLAQTTRLTPTEVIRRTGPGLLTKTIGEALLSNESWIDGGIAVLPYQVFHPMPNHTQDGNQPGDYVIDGETKAVHLWFRSWQRPQDEGTLH